MRETVATLTFQAYSLLLPIAQVAFFVLVVVLVPMAFVRRTRETAGSLMFLASFLFGLTTWFLGAGVTFVVFGWFGLIIGLLLLGVGVVPLGVIGAFFSLKEPGLAIWLIVMAILTYGARVAGGVLASMGSREQRDR